MKFKKTTQTTSTPTKSTNNKYHEDKYICNLRGSRIKLRPHADKLVEVVWAENGFVTCKVLKVVHDNSHKQIKELKTK